MKIRCEFYGKLLVLPMGHPPVLHAIAELADSTMNPIGPSGTAMPPEPIKVYKNSNQPTLPSFQTNIEILPTISYNSQEIN
jgi:hypothetical protein